ncbi:hypothetical protein RI065_05785 [Mycoplasmatota bacterium zrk1]
MKKILFLMLTLLLMGCEDRDYILSDSKTIKYVKMRTIEVDDEQFGLYKTTDATPNDNIGLEFHPMLSAYYSDKENKAEGYYLEHLGNYREYKIRYNEEFYNGFDLIEQGILSIEDYREIGFPFVAYINDEIDSEVQEINKIKPHLMDYVTVKTMEFNGREFELIKAQPKENEKMICFNFSFASVDFFEGVYNTGCLNEYKVRYNNQDYKGNIVIERGLLTIEELQSLGFPIEETEIP